MTSNPSRPHRLRATATAIALSPSLLLAQTATPAPAASSVMITGNPLRSADIAAPTSVLSGNDLVRRRGSTLGETLDGLPGLSSSYFGPNANRPMIRGQDGDRIRVLSNSGVPLDASALSYDHAVPIDPLVIERIEVLRGPAALLYGGSAVGGVVNAIDNRIPKAALDGVSGSAELRYGGPATERGAAALVESGGKGFVVHADGFWRETDDMKTPWYSRPLEGGGSERVNTILNSASKSYGGALGGSMVWDKGYLGASVDTYHSDYGVVAEPDVTIDMVLEQADAGRRGARPGRRHQRRQRAVAVLRLPAPGNRRRRRGCHHLQEPRLRPAAAGRACQAGPGRRQLERRVRPAGRGCRVLGIGRRGLRAQHLDAPVRRVRAGGMDTGRCQAQRRRACRPCARGFGRRCRRADAVRARAVAFVHTLQRGIGRHLQADAVMATEWQPGLHRARANLLRAVCQRPACRHRRL